MAPLRAWNSPALAWLSLVLVLSSEGAQILGRCRMEGECPCVLNRSIRLSRLMDTQAQDLLTTYQSSQGDFSETFCKLSLKEVPRPEITGYGTLERLRNVRTTLGLFRQHIAVVTEEQKNLQEPENPLLKELQDAQDQIGDLDASIRRLLQTLHPNEPTQLAGPRRGSTPSRNTFQQKIYGCVVLTNHREFLAHVLQELKDLKLKDQTCVGRRRRSFRRPRPRTS